MAENEDLTQPSPTPGRPADEPTRALPPTPGGPEPTLPLPTSAWARQAEVGASPAPTGTPHDGQGSPRPPSATGAQPQAYGPQTYPQGWGSPPQGGTPQPGAQWYGAGSSSHGPQGYGQAGRQPYGPGAPLPYGQGYSGYPQHPGYYPASQYYHQPPRPPKKRLPLALLALVVALVLGWSGFYWAATQLTGAQTPTITRPQTDPNPGQADPNQGSKQPGQGQQGGATTGKEVGPTESAGVVLIEARTGAGAGAGTGMVISPDGKVLTNYHVVAGSETLSVTIADSGDTYSATVVGFDQTKDVALLQLEDATGLTTVNVDTTVPSEGSAVSAVGNARGGGELVKASGTVTDTDQSLTVSSDSPWGSTEDLSGLIETNARAVPGDSGGPMYDSDDEVIGMTTAGSTRARTSYAVPIATALAVVEQVESGQDAGTVRVGPAGYLGVRVADADQSGDGKTITEVVEGSPADSAGVTAGSRLTRVGDTPIRTTTNLATVIRALEPGVTVTIRWTAPNGSQREATVTLGSSPVN